MEYGICRRCGKKHWLEKHHIFPKSKFKDDKNIIYLCSNCHTEYHQKLGTIKSNNKGFYLRFYMSWLWGTLILLIILGLTQIIF